jgi:anthranilate phosphoribosyltransferase
MIKKDTFMDMPTAIQQVLDRHDLSTEQMTATMQLIMTGQATAAQIGGFLIGLRMKGESSTEIAAAAQVMRKLSSKVKVDKTHLVDTCGTGGDSSGTFNVSTATAFVVAAAGGRVAKHGNRSVSSKSGSADVLEAAGVNLNLKPEQVAECINEIGIGFLFAQNHHSAMKHAIMPRKEMAVRTVFNLLGPLTNPANAPFQVLGVFSRAWLRPMAEVLKILGSQHVMVVHAADGLDEISIASETHVVELHKGVLSEYTISPEQFNLPRGSLNEIRVETAQESLKLIQQALEGEAGSAKNIIALNAGAALYVSGMANNLEKGIKIALDIMDSGKANAKLQQLVNQSNRY